MPRRSAEFAVCSPSAHFHISEVSRTVRTCAWNLKRSERLRPCCLSFSGDNIFKLSDFIFITYIDLSPVLRFFRYLIPIPFIMFFMCFLILYSDCYPLYVISSHSTCIVTVVRVSTTCFVRDLGQGLFIQSEDSCKRNYLACHYLN